MLSEAATTILASAFPLAVFLVLLIFCSALKSGWIRLRGRIRRARHPAGSTTEPIDAGGAAPSDPQSTSESATREAGADRNEGAQDSLIYMALYYPALSAPEPTYYPQSNPGSGWETEHENGHVV
ncbi:hypothetical protein GYMLUDRAFT_247423 [Collybiopsis luxurians FD-317 M1]|uniref:Uncharacterized protein n=1 Tax=Collybiopsis luxurians FD-317 M1 TaxID=944289 RepID=A0A0D0B1B4_9AGAR|nr:hypothetical protein GYMLUDRAFT_247423 [Collybiopsis luxurians FD-317 M1]